MERLTVRHENGLAYYDIVPGESVIDRLATIEDILGADYDLGHIRELVEADRDGRCTILIAKPGEIIYRLNRNTTPRICETTIKMFLWDEKGPRIYVPYFLGDESSMVADDMSEFGTTLFKNKKDAEAKAKKDGLL